MDGIELKVVKITNNDYKKPAPEGHVNKSFDSNGDPRSEAVVKEFDDAINVRLQPQPAPENVANVGNTGDEQDESEDEYEDEEDEGEPNAFVQCISRTQTTIASKWKTFAPNFWSAFWLVLLAGYFVYFGFAMDHEKLVGEPSIRLCWVTCVVVFFIIMHFVLKYLGDGIGKRCRPLTDYGSTHDTKISWTAVSVLFLFFIIFTIVDIFTNSKNSYNLVSAAGLIVFVFLLYIGSHNPAKVKWRPVVWGLALQFIFALIILRLDAGYDAFEWLGDRMAEFFDHSHAGSLFLFGETYTDHFFAFSVLPTVIFFSCVISALYHMGAMQVIIAKVAWVMQVTMGTTAGESLNAAGNIFIGQTEAPLLIRPLLKDMTPSEIHAVMTGGFATVAGGVLAAYISMGVPANHLISASVMSAPAALAISKLFYPETKKSKTKASDVAHLPKSTSFNLIEAASEGASSAIALVANIAANLIAFLALLEFVNTALTWFGQRVGIESLTLQFIFSYVMWPFSLLMGVNIDDCRKVGTMIGVKIFLNEFIAFEDLGNIISNKAKWLEHVALNGTWEWLGDDVILYSSNGTETLLQNGIMTERSITISTYALCGFANISSIGIQLGALGAMVPKKKTILAKIVIRAMIAGVVADFMTACIAGLYFQGDDV